MLNCYAQTDTELVDRAAMAETTTITTTTTIGSSRNFVGRKECVTSHKKACVGGYNSYK